VDIKDTFYAVTPTRNNYTNDNYRISNSRHRNINVNDDEVVAGAARSNAVKSHEIRMNDSKEFIVTAQPICTIILTRPYEQTRHVAGRVFGMNKTIL